MKVLGFTALAASVMLSGCSMTNGDPSSTEGTIKKWDTVDKTAHTASRPNWQFRVIEVTKADNDQLMYTYDLSEKMSLFGEMYIRLPEGKYNVKTQCFLSIPTQVNDRNVRVHTHVLDVKAHTKTRFSIDQTGSGCKSKPFSRVI